MIVFKTVRFKNFGSFGNSFTEVKLGEKSTTLVCGSNGNGKSFALLDSIAFGLYGRPFRNINIPQLVNSINKKNCVVEINFSIGKNEFKVVRGLAPKLFEIYKDGNLLNQDAKIKDYQEVLESQILGMNFKTFSQVVVLGSSSFVPFMQLTPTDRRQVIENILDISIFSQMNVVVKDKVNGVKSELDTTNTSIEVTKAQIGDTKETIQSLVKNTQQIIEERKAAERIRIEELKAAVRLAELKGELPQPPRPPPTDAVTEPN
jgi:DNA repair exonuclease SbcCD ATPase subunit